MIQTYALHEIHTENEFPFSPLDYCRFKFGEASIAVHFGTKLANGFIQRFAEYLLQDHPIIVISSPYQFIPTATFALKNQFMKTLNRWLYEQGKTIAKETKVSRLKTYVDDYGQLDKEQRIKLIGDDAFYIDNTFVKNHTLIFLDDIKITGSHEMLIRKMIQKNDLKNDIFLIYYAQLSNPSIRPDIENYLNYYGLTSINDLYPIIESPSFEINTRIVKYILNQSPSDFDVFLQKTNTSFQSLLLDMAIGNNYHLIEEYQQNVQTLANHVK